MGDSVGQQQQDAIPKYVPAHPKDQEMFMERYIAINLLINEFEDENNLLAYRAAKTERILREQGYEYLEHLMGVAPPGDSDPEAIREAESYRRERQRQPSDSERAEYKWQRREHIEVEQREMERSQATERKRAKSERHREYMSMEEGRGRQDDFEIERRRRELYEREMAERERLYYHRPSEDEFIRDPEYLEARGRELSTRDTLVQALEIPLVDPTRRQISATRSPVKSSMAGRHSTREATATVLEVGPVPHLPPRKSLSPQKAFATPSAIRYDEDAAMEES
ncbi:hypothetical protein L204_102753 [Cryptococcus depauperatus]|nr:hypothetical protein L204_00497 [Cryptococcus depauperatus CBS 7855]